MATNRMSGNLLGVKLNGQFIDCEMSCELNFENDLLPASPIDEGRWKSYIDGVRSWNVAVNAGTLMRMSGTGFNTLLNWFIVGGLMEVSIETKAQDIYPSLIISGNVRLRNGGLSASVNTLSTWNTTLEGDGALNIQINPNIVFAIATDDSKNELLQDGIGNLVVSANDSEISGGELGSSYGSFSIEDYGQSAINIPHGLYSTPSYYLATPVSSGAIDLGVLSISASETNIIITPVFTNNDSQILTYTWEARV